MIILQDGKIDGKTKNQEGHNDQDHRKDQNDKCKDETHHIGGFDHNSRAVKPDVIHIRERCCQCFYVIRIDIGHLSAIVPNRFLVGPNLLHILVR